MNTAILLSTWQDKIPSESAFLLSKQLENLDEKDVITLSLLSLKEPFIGLILGIFFGVFGVDRFYKGDIGLGVAKLLLCWLTFGIWWLIDLFLVYRGIKKDNLQKIMQILAFTQKDDKIANYSNQR